MARHDKFNLFQADLYSYPTDPTTAFVDWFTSDDGLPDDSYQATVFEHGRQRGEVDAPTCVMDYLFVWLVEGGAVEYCPTYEDWLLTIISIADQLRRGRFGSRWTRPLPDGSAPEYPDPEDRALDEIAIDAWGGATDPKRTIDLPLLAAEIDLTHPALSRVVFDRVAARLARRARLSTCGALGTTQQDH